MKLRSVFLIIVLLIITYFTIISPTNLLRPFYYIKDLLFSSVHAISENNNLSASFKDSIINNLKEEIVYLQKLNNINLSISDFDMINGTIISRNREYWFNSLTINRGSEDGVEIDMAVVDNDGLIGRISMVTNNTATIKLITSNDTKNKISAVIHNGNEDIYGIINGYDIENNLLYLIISDNIKIKEDSVVETTGMGGIFPRGILIGNVRDMIKKEDGVTNIVRVKLSSNIKGERYVTVLSRKKISDS